ncbi:glycosyltransferase family 39 protein [Roseibium salinum]|uniref:Glycosyltransferase family 39 protein n=1 Tax=Roseibium salinum TaxID=1604349 RepID=A0ABT3R7C7_9HYPH|nr:glycosyltransferase family 39 protein [Roseibium sp. DSM 29163]MCX2725199.1 glycosyltransferase family 39 protein [Roseibium sp. DSM 29163]
MTASRAALWYGGLVCLLFALIPTLTFPNPPLDVVEGFAWGRELQLGYTKHPPMQAWLLELSYHLTGGHYFGGYWLSALCAALGYLMIWTLSKRLGLSGWQAFWAIALTSVTFYFTLPLPEFNPNILQIPVWAGMILLFHRALEKGHWLDWVALGALAAFGLYTKYFVLLLIGAIGLYTLVFGDARRHLASAGPWLAALVCAALLVPHILWLLDTDLLTFRYAASRSNPPESFLDHILNPLSFLAAQIGNHAGPFLVVLAGLGWTGVKTFRTTRRQSVQSLAAHGDRFLLWFAFVPLVVVLVSSAVSGNEFEHMWGTPMFVLSGIAAVRFLALPGSLPFPRRALAAAIAIQAIFLGVIFGQAVLEPYWKQKQTRMHYPGKAVAAELAAIWKSETGSDLAYVAGDMWSAAHITLYAPGRPSMFYLHDRDVSPWIDVADVQARGLMVVWRGDRQQPPSEFLRLYPGAVRDGHKVFAYQTPGEIPDVTINWLIIPPGDVATEPE